MVDQHPNFAYSTVATAPSPATSGTTVTVQTSEGTRFSTFPFNATVAPANSTPAQIAASSEIVRITGQSGDVLTITRAQEGTSARTIVVGDQIFVAPTKKTFTDIEPSRTTFSDANYTVLPSDKYVAQVGTLTAPRTVTLPAASSVAAGTELLIADESKTVTKTNFLTVTPAGADAIIDVANITATVYNMSQQGAVTAWRSNGSNAWILQTPGESRPVSFWSHPNPVAIPNNVWTPIPWGTFTSDKYAIGGTPPTATATVAAASNAVALPQATIHAATASASLAAAGFASSGWACITISGTDTVFHYTGLSGKDFTGCNTSPNASISTGTMATGNVISQVTVDWAFPTGGFYAIIAQVAFASSATGYRGIRYRTMDGTFNFILYTNMVPGIAIAGQALQVTGQPLHQTVSTTPDRVEVIQTSGGVLNSIPTSLDAPGLSMSYISGQV